MARRIRHSFFDEDFLRRLERLRLIAKRLSGRPSPGARRSRRLGDGLEFADHRDYTPGDDIRFVDWPYYARMDKLLLRLFHEHSEAEVMILLDVSASMAPAGAMDKFDFARRTAAALAYVAMASLERVVVQPFAAELGEPLRTGRNRDQILSVLDFLAALVPWGRTDLERCSTLLARQGGRPGTLILISDLADCQSALPGALARLRKLAGEAAVIHVHDPADAQPALVGSTLLQAAEEPARVTLTITPEVLASYRQRWGEHTAACQRACVAAGAAYVLAGSDLPFDRLVLHTLRRAGVLTG